MTLRLKGSLADHKVTQGAFADAIGVSRSAAVALLNHGEFPKTDAKTVWRQRIEKFLRDGGISTRGVFQKVAPSRSNATAPVPNPVQDEEVSMLLRKQTLSQAARKHFELQRDPFGIARELADVFLSPDIRYVREAMFEKVRHGGFVAIVGESGSGKSTLREELLDRIQRESIPVLTIQPYVLAMEDNDTKGKTLKSQHIAEAIMSAVAPLDQVKSSPEARFLQVHKALIASSRAGHQHVLIIEEAHSLPTVTLKHLKRFTELKDGMKPLLAIILVAQPELLLKLSEHDPNVREVSQRIEIVQLQPLNADLEKYLSHRFNRIGVPIGRVFEDKAIDALRTRLTPSDKRRPNEGSLLYPLIVGNVLTAAINAAAELGLPRVNADVVKGV